MTEDRGSVPSTAPPRLDRGNSRAARSRMRRFARTGSVFGEIGSLVATLLVGLGLATLAAFVTARIYDAITDADGVAGFDQPVLHAMTRLRSPALDSILEGISVVFGPIGMPVIGIIAAVGLSLSRRSWQPAVLLVTVGLGSGLMTLTGKDIIDRSRPPHSEAVPPYEMNPSFPSGHTLTSLVVLGAIAYLLILYTQTVRVRVAIVATAAVLSFLVGASRIALGAHWTTDVLAGWVLGAAWLAVVITAHRLFLRAPPGGHPRETEAAAAAIGPRGRAAGDDGRMPQTRLP